MKTTSKAKFVSDVPLEQTAVKSRAPFTVSRDENQRQFVRIELAAPMALRKLKDITDSFWPVQEEYPIDGHILNISPGGVLIETDLPLGENEVILMRFRLQDVEVLEHVLGLVKRVDRDQNVWLSGIEFVSWAALADRFTTAEMELIRNQVGEFRQQVTTVLKRYLYTEQQS